MTVHRAYIMKKRDKKLSKDMTPEGADIKKKHRRGLSKGKKIAISVILVLYAAVIAAVSFVVFYRPKIDQRKKVFIETVTDSDGRVVRVETVHNAIDGTYNILLLGHDRAAMLTDVFMLVNVNNNENTITVTQIPRDTWISDNDGISIPTNKINAVFSTYYYSYYGSGESEDAAYKHALMSLTEMLEENLSIEISNSAIMDLDGFINIVDALGGVEIDVPAAMTYYDPAQNLNINIPAGHQTLNGAAAEGFVRYRAGYLTADLGRQNAQKQFLSALFSKVKSTVSITNVSKLTELAGEISNNLVSDMSVGDLVYYAKNLLSCDLSSMNMMTIPGNLANSYYVINRAAARDVINASYNVYDKPITDGIFDTAGIFNCSWVYSMNEAYYLPADQVYDNSVYNGQEISENPIEIPRH